MIENIVFLASLVEKADQPLLPESLDFASGIFAAALAVMSLLAYRATKMRRLLFVSGAFALYSFRTIIPRLDIIFPNLDISTAMDVMLSVTGFVILGLFFLAIIKK